MRHPDGGHFEAVLFDLDGTLIDTAPDMVAVLQALQRSHGLAEVAYDRGRANVSNGAAGLIRVGFPDVDPAARERLHREYLDRYALRVCVESVLFPGLDTLLDLLDRHDLPWGVVTNKPERLTAPLLEQLALAQRSAATVSGDTLSVRKPDPEPLLHACRLADVDPTRAIYVGDASRDIEAGRRAGMTTVAAAYGYITEDDDPAVWGADRIAADTVDLAQILLKGVNLST